MQVFISHSSHDKDFAARIANDLLLYELEVWYDEWSIRPGDSIPGAIQAGLASSDYVLLVISRAAIESNWVMEELNSTLFSVLSAERTRIIPVLLEECSLPPLLRHRKYLTFTDEAQYEASLNQLVSFLYQDYSNAPPPIPLIPGFRDVRLLGEGGFSTVYKATDARTSAVKAIKIPKGRHRLEPEIARARRLTEHEGIVPIERVLPYKDRVILVMPYAGHSLKWHLEHKKIQPQQIDPIVKWMKKLIEVLAFAHSRNIIHRDIKPSNILIDEFGELRVVDFGIAQKIQYIEFQRSTIVRGTLCYMSPEQQLAERVTQQSDIYSFGAVFYELVTGEKPVGRFRNPRFYNNQIPPRLEEIIEKCLERDLADRYQTATDVLADLNQMSEEPVAPAVSGQERIIGESSLIKDVLSLAGRVAGTSATVLITGEPGTSKELIARFIHQQYSNLAGRDLPFVVANVPAVPEVLIESELFGHERGAFTGAVARRKGLFEVANGGTLLLDEISGLPLSVQSRLFDALQTGEILPIGGMKPVAVAVRIIATTSQSLEEMVEKGMFRRDLYYRLNVIPIHVPALRERKEDIPALVRFFSREFSTRTGREQAFDFSDGALELLSEYSWPHNIRELRDLVEQAGVIAGPAKSLIQPEDIEPLLFRDKNERDSGRLPTLGEARLRAEKTAIESALRQTNRNVLLAAKLLNVSRSNLARLIKKHEL